MIDYETLEKHGPREFKAALPFPWFGLKDFLTPTAFRELYGTFPSLDLFEMHRGRPRVHGQRPHDRYYLALDQSIYGNSGTVRRRQLSRVWRDFVAELEESERYHAWLRDLLDVPTWEMRFAWHVGVRGDEVTPHADGEAKIGTHILYFNTSEDWQPAWGGQTLLLSDKRTAAMNPEFKDFGATVETEMVDNRSLLFKNGPAAWHGVRPLQCPAGHHRRLFNIILEQPGDSRARGGLGRRLMSWLSASR